MKRKGFTLIELLIVIAIILILIAIALPNFLEAQIRARVVNSVGEMRSLETAIVSYSLDRKRHMGDGFEVGGGDAEGNIRVYSQLTSPHDYVKSIPYDEFNSADRAADNAGAGAGTRDTRNNVYRFYAARWRCLASGNGAGTGEECKVKASARGQVGGFPFDPDYAYAGKWIVVSPGPDRSHGYGEWIMHRTALQTGNQRIYSPTNGTVSYGDLARWGN
jgi:prepilin-type N-terminal cleavage/methylation domain-containing protein